MKTILYFTIIETIDAWSGAYQSTCNTCKNGLVLCIEYALLYTLGIFNIAIDKIHGKIRHSHPYTNDNKVLI